MWIKHHGYLPSKLYFFKSFDFFKSRFPQRRVMFIVTTDDPEWTQEMFKGRSDVAFSRDYNVSS